MGNQFIEGSPTGKMAPITGKSPFAFISSLICALLRGKELNQKFCLGKTNYKYHHSLLFSILHQFESSPIT